MYQKLYKWLFGSFAILGAVLCAIGLILYGTIGIQGGQMMDSSGNPSGLYVNQFILLIFTVIGGVFLLIGAIGLFIRHKKERNKKYLKENGRTIYAKILKVEPNYSVKINGRYAYQVIAEYVEEETKTIYRFRSEYIKDDLGVPNGSVDSVRIYIDPKNKKKYYMDLSSIIGRNGYKVENY